jgi:hypothetical protein
MYFPKSQIKENLYTNGGEFEIASTKRDYIGPYFSTSKGQFYTGKNYNDTPNNLLVKTTLKSTPSESILSEPLPKNYYIIDDSYYNSKNIDSRGIAPRTPIQTLGKPTDKDIQNGFFYRYFVKKGNEGRFIEISKEEHLKFQNKDTSVQWQLYTPTRIKWDIQGDREQVYNGNKTVVSLTEQRKNLPGFTLFFRDQFDKFWIGK